MFGLYRPRFFGLTVPAFIPSTNSRSATASVRVSRRTALIAPRCAAAKASARHDFASASRWKVLLTDFPRAPGTPTPPSQRCSRIGLRRASGNLWSVAF